MSHPERRYPDLCPRAMCQEEGMCALGLCHMPRSKPNYNLNSIAAELRAIADRIEKVKP